MPKTIEAILNDLDPIELTVRAQVYNPYDDDTLHWSTFFPYQSVNSTRLAEIGGQDIRFTASRRPWDAPGMQLVPRTAKIVNGEMVPIESWFGLGEKEIQRHLEQTGGNAAVALEIMKASIPARVRTLAMADYRRLEVDAFKVWSSGTLVVTDPDGDASTYTVDYGIAGSHYVALAATFAGAANAYTQALDFLRAAEAVIGPVAGMLAPITVIRAIQADAPATGMFPSYQPTLSEVEARLGEEFGTAFKFIRADWTVDLWNAGTNAWDRTAVWDATRVAAVPQGMAVGTSKFAPVYRAEDLQLGIPDNSFEQDGVRIFPFAINDGKGLKVQAQLNAMPWPDEGRIYVGTGAA